MENISFRLENWGRYLAGSKLNVDSTDALIVNESMRKLDIRSKDILYFCFCVNLTPESICRYINLDIRPARLFVEAFNTAMTEIKAILSEKK